MTPIGRVGDRCIACGLLRHRLALSDSLGIVGQFRQGTRGLLAVDNLEMRSHGHVTGCRDLLELDIIGAGAQLVGDLAVDVR